MYLIQRCQVSRIRRDTSGFDTFVTAARETIICPGKRKIEKINQRCGVFFHAYTQSLHKHRQLNINALQNIGIMGYLRHSAPYPALFATLKLQNKHSREVVGNMIPCR